MNERVITPVQNAILNLAVETNYDAAPVSESVKNETFADIVANYNMYNKIYKPMTLQEKAEWFSNACIAAQEKTQYWANKFKTTNNDCKYKTNMEFWAKQVNYYAGQRDRLYKLINSLVTNNG